MKNPYLNEYSLLIIGNYNKKYLKSYYSKIKNQINLKIIIKNLK